VRLLDLVRAEAKAGTCVLYTTHYMEEAETLCDRLAIMDQAASNFSWRCKRRALRVPKIGIKKVSKRKPNPTR